MKDTLKLWVPECYAKAGCLPGNGEHPAKLAYFAHLVTTKRPDASGFVRLNWSVLREQIDNRSISQARQLFGPQLEISPHEVGVRATGFRWNFDFVPAQIAFNAPHFVAKLQRYKERKRREYNELEANLEAVLRGVTLDVDDVPEAVAALPDKPGTISEPHRRFVIAQQLEQVKAGDFGIISRSSRTGRVHCLHNRIHKEFRQHILFNGENSSEYDLASSQPYFLSKMFSCPQLSKAVLEGSFYKRLNDVLKCPKDLDDPLVYDAFKESVLATIYARPINGFKYWLEGDGAAAEIWIAMGRVYPGVCEFISGYTNKHGDTALAIELQRRESKIFVEGQLSSLLAQGVPAIPLHDGLLVPTEKGKLVKKELEKRLPGGRVRGEERGI